MAEPGTIENGVLIGHDGYLFLAGGAHSVSDYVTGARQVDPIYYNIFKENLQSRIAWATANHTQFLHVIMPDKQSIFPQAWSLAPPNKLGAAYVARNAELANHLLYPVGLLSTQPDKTLTRVDTHLSAYGSLLVASHLVEKFSGTSQNSAFAQFCAQIDQEIITTGDLGSKLVPPVQEHQKIFRELEKATLFNNNLEGANNGGIDLRFNPNALYQKRVVIFGDSFGRDIAWFLQLWYTEVHFFRSGYFHPEIADLIKPDILITENVERYLDHCLADESRGNFLLFPYVNEKAYSPSREFAIALSAVLNYPRSPYLEFMAQFNPPAVTPPNPLHRYHNANMTDPPETQGLLKILEPARHVPRHMPAFIADLSGRGLGLNLPPEQHVHGSFLVQRENVLLFGPSNLVDENGCWSCEARAHKRQFLSYMKYEFYDHMWPGPKPQVDEKATEMRLSTVHLHTSDVETIETPLFLATPLEPPIWGRWIASVAPKIMQYNQHGTGRKFFCYATLPWQKAFLAQLGLRQDQILNHDPGRAYICRDVMTVEYSETNMSISALERLMFFEIVAAHKIPVPSRRKIFVSRLSRSKANPNYRVLLNEDELATMLAALGFALIEPETLSFVEQLSIFARADEVVFLGGSGVYNAAFCAPGTRVVTIESSNTYITAHTELFASLGLDYGVIFGQQDQADPTPDHKRWRVDVARVQAHVMQFFGT